MSITRIKVENLAKQYRLGEIGTGTISHDLNRWWAKLRGKEDPFALVGEVNNREQKTEEDYVWALRNINFEVKEGEILGIIGRNGAGKSTLLKLLSKVTGPSRGEIKINGRIGALLEVGTGMHPELTGVENIYLNGAILGMTKKEIKSKLDDIIEFAGIAKYAETPFKRYSSGMRVRLGFAVAAFLEPEILIVDEVLAVGDIEFQKKAIGKMNSISKTDGRTVLFVSHNMQAVKQLCNRAILIDNGEIIFSGSTDETIEKYYSLNSEKSDSIKEWTLDNAIGNENIKLLKVGVQSLNEKAISIESGFLILIKFLNLQENINLDCTLELITLDGIKIYHKGVLVITDKSSKKGVYDISVKIPPNLLNQNHYSINLIFGKDQKHLLFNINEVVSFEITEIGMDSSTRRPGVLYLDFEKEINFENV